MCDTTKSNDILDLYSRSDGLDADIKIYVRILVVWHEQRSQSWLKFNFSDSEIDMFCLAVTRSFCRVTIAKLLRKSSIDL